MNNELRIIRSGGGTGGHIFPAVSIANAIKAKYPEAKILLVGALGRMEMQRVPAAGYEIKGLPICGFDRKHLFKNIAVLFKIWKSQRMAKTGNGLRRSIQTLTLSNNAYAHALPASGQVTTDCT